MKYIYIIGIFILSFSSCSSFLEEYSQDLSKIENIADLDELLLGGAYHNSGYYYIMSSTGYFRGNPLNIFINFMSDELQQNNTTTKDVWYSSELFGYYTWQKNVGITVQGNNINKEDTDWNLMYKYINVANMVIDELPKVNITNDKENMDKIRIEGEAHFLRALYYFNLVNLYAEPYTPSKAASSFGIPIKTTAYIEDKKYTCNTIAEVYEQILADLKRAEECLIQTEHKSVYRADISAVYLLKSRIYLYLQDWKNAQTYAQKVLKKNNNLTDLNSFTGEDNIFTSSSPECIFSMGGHFLTCYLYGFDRYRDAVPYFISDDLAQAYPDDDLRKKYYISHNGFGYVYKKIYWGSKHNGTPCSVSDNFLFRTSEAYLNLAEAAAMNDDVATARDAIIQLQSKRFNTPPSLPENKKDLIDLIRKERQRELCLEGHRWYDLRRYTVCKEFPWSKSFCHTYTELNSKNQIIRSRTYELKEYDQAYTLDFPKEVSNFQNTITINKRLERNPIKTIENQ